MRGRVLVVEDDVSMSNMLEKGLRLEDFETRAVASARDALEAMNHEDFGVIVTDLNLGGMTGVELCRRIVEDRPDVPVIVITAYGSMDTAVAAIRAGAYDFIAKPFDMDAVIVALDRALRHHELRKEVKRLRAAVARTTALDDLLGSSTHMQRVYAMIERVAKSDSTVLVTGESGTGKELVARALHKRSRRSTGPFVAVNCAALPEALLESELFGHVRGAFTDAKQSQKGLLLESDGGTLFLDEIGDMPPGLQVKLLRALEERVVRPVGGSTEVPFDVRIVAATNRDLEQAVETGRVREDFYYRINVITIELPPLRARGGDVLLLAQHFLDRFAAQANKEVVGISPGAAGKLMAYSWPGNVRELRNCIERAVALAHFDQIAVDDLPEKIRDYTSRHIIVAGEDPSELVPLEEVERRYILSVLRAAGGNRALASRILGVDRKTLYRRIAEYGVAEE
jgi:two-component system, NtrC family, response regulator AtoC